MVIAMNLGNTHFVLGWEEQNRICVVKYPTVDLRSKRDFIQVIGQMTEESPIKKETVTGAVISSVVPGLTSCLMAVVQELYGLAPLLIDPNLTLDLDLSAYDQKKLGTDRIAIGEAAISRYAGSLIVFDFGTATTINVIDAGHRFLGGSILPGLLMGLEALARDTQQLPLVEISGSSKLIGENTGEGLISGAIFGNAAMLDGMVRRIEGFFGERTTVLVTGGSAGYIISYCETPVIHEPDLLIAGLLSIYKKNAVEGGSE